MGLKKRPVQEITASPETCVGCAKDIATDEENSVVEVRVGTLKSRPRKAKFNPEKQWGFMHTNCFAMTMGLSEV
jgi:hypothetical protein